MVRTNTDVEVNVLKFNLPSILTGIISVITIIGFMQAKAADRAELDAKIESRLTYIETDRAKSITQYQAWQLLVNTDISKTPLMESRLTSNEAQIQATNARADRQADANMVMQKSLSDINTNLQLLTQRVEMSLDVKHSSLLGSTPRELNNGVQ